MNVFALFIRRPVATILLSIGVILIGALGYAHLPVAALPNVDRPTIEVEAELPGADAGTVATAVSQPLERQLGTIAGLKDMFSWSENGGTWIDMQFALGKNSDIAAANVQAAINAAGPYLPRDLPQPPTYHKANPGGAPVVMLGVTSDVIAPAKVFEVVDGIIGTRLSQLPGVASVVVSGVDRGAVRVRADPRRMASLGLSLEDVRRAIRAASLNLPKGTMSDRGKEWILAANDQLVSAADYRSLPVAWRNGAPVRLMDLATVTDSLVNDKEAAWLGDHPAVIIRVYKQADANVVETVDAVKAALPELAHWIPPAVHVRLVFDRTLLIRAAIADMQMTIAIAVGLAMLVVLLFLRRLRAALIPALAIPVALAATLAVMAVLGFNLDNLSLMAMAVAVGFIVDDAVIVLENVIRRMDSGQTPVQAAIASARQMGFTIIAITASLIAALTPVLFMPDIVGRYLREFGVTLAAAILFSAVVSLTLTPVLCSRLQPRGEEKDGGEGVARGQPPSWLLRAYRHSLTLALGHPACVLLVLLTVTAGSGWLYEALPKSFLPTQDTALLFGRTRSASNISFSAMETLQRQVAQHILADPAVVAMQSYIGANNGNTLSHGDLTIGLAPPGKRRETIGQVIQRLRRATASIAGVRVTLTPAQDLSLGTQNASSRYQYILTGPDTDTLFHWSEEMRVRMSRLPQLRDIDADGIDRDGLGAAVTIDRARAATLGVTPLAIDNTLYDAFGERQINMIYLPSSYHRVVLEVDPIFGTDPAALANIYVPGVNAAQVPLGAVAQLSRVRAPMWVAHADHLPSETLSFNLAPGVAIGDAITAIRTAEREVHLPGEIHAGFKGEALLASQSNVTELALFGAAVVAVYLVLGMLYESFLHPLTILSTLPSAVFGALLALHLYGYPFGLIAAIACVLTVGMVLKNAIMMVDFALQLQRSAQLRPREAIFTAALQRARPILMTSCVAITTAMPLALGTGPGHELRQPLGIASIGGLLAAQLLTLYSTPAAYLLLARLLEKLVTRHEKSPEAPKQLAHRVSSDPDSPESTPI